MQGTSLNVKFKLAVCPSGLSYSVGNGLLPSSVYAQSNVFLCALSLYNITVICQYVLSCTSIILFMSIIESSISTLSMSVYAYNYTCLWF